MRNKRIVNKEDGVTLLALVMTIIIMLIIAGVTISSLTGDHGTVEEAKNTVSDIEHASITEEVMKMTMIIPEYDEAQVEHFLNGMVSDGISSKFEISDQTTDSLKVEIWNAKGDKSYSYVISNTNQYGLRVVDESATFPVVTPNTNTSGNTNVQTNTSVTNNTSNTTTNSSVTNQSTGNSSTGGNTNTQTNTNTNTNTSGGGSTNPTELIVISNEKNVSNVKYELYYNNYYGYRVYTVSGYVESGKKEASFLVTVNAADVEFQAASNGYGSSNYSVTENGNKATFKYKSSYGASYSTDRTFGYIFIPI